MRRRTRLGGLPRPSFAAAGKQLLGAPTKVVPTIETLPSQPSKSSPPGPIGQNIAVANSSSAKANGTSDPSPELRSEMAALLSFYASRIAAARLSLAPSVAAAVVQALMNEQALALRGLMERLHAATERQRIEKPKRPTTSPRRDSDGAKPA
jgi:hypothetical protein